MFGDTPLVIVQDSESLAEVVARLENQPVIGIDTESDSFHHYQEKVCLIQVSDLEQDYIIDPLRIDDISPLTSILEDPNIVKILHGADYDVVCMKRDFGIRMENLFDTMIAAQFLGFAKVGLADLIGRFFGVIIDKKYQRHDWAKRPLEDEHLEYARGDTHWLLAVREVMTLKLERAGRLDHVLEECAILQEREWSGRTADPADFLRVKRSSTLDQKGLRVLRALWNFRDEQARRMDRPAFKVMPDALLISLSQSKPQSRDDLDKLLRKTSTLNRKHGSRLLEAVDKGLNDKDPIPKPPRKKSARPKNSAGIERLMGPLKEWRNNVVNQKNLAPVVVASNTVLKEIARAAPTDTEALRQVEGIRTWQVDEFGDQILEVVNNTLVPTKRKRKRNRRSRSEGEALG